MVHEGKIEANLVMGMSTLIQNSNMNCHSLRCSVECSVHKSDFLSIDSDF